MIRRYTMSHKFSKEAIANVQLFSHANGPELSRKLREDLGKNAGPALEAIDRWLRRAGKKIHEFLI